MPLPNDALLSNMENVLISEELNYDKQTHGGIFFVNGFGSSEKTYIWNILTSALRGRSDIVLAVASSGIASQLIQEKKVEKVRGRPPSALAGERGIPTRFLISFYRVSTVNPGTGGLDGNTHSQSSAPRQLLLLCYSRQQT
ncbi:ATP-dependent DNA helicase PIF1-like [Senna tora]|uniref:ATP-dependent DNA helicase n=1 Tax=Senna tora TaxID=362788 RepID=A0A834SYD0_9FABA|nr:ATP-dependent DNA helicase PIF1-like [Senna tora]